MGDDIFFDDNALYQWEFKNKGYAHFDTSYSKCRVEEILNNLKENGKISHSFYPFIRFSIPKLKRDPETKKRYEDKENPRYIMHTARTDANIYSFYRNILMNKYHDLLYDKKIQDSVIAYRRIPVEEGKQGNKCNVHFANEAIDEIISQAKKHGDGCSAIAMDIKGFFDNLNHKIIKCKWCEVMGFDNGLTDEHWTIFKNITRYKYIDAKNLERLLGIDINKISYLNRQKQNKNKRSNESKFEKLELQICSSKDLHDKVLPNLSTSNTLGIPQGTTISDVIANMYMIDFDVIMTKFAAKYRGYYRRYSDDILFICPTPIQDYAISFIKRLIKLTGRTIYISDNKTLVSQFKFSENKIPYKTFNNKGEIQKPFEYLGLSFDGRNRRIRQSTISGFYEKLSNRIYREVEIAHNKLTEKKGIAKPTPDEVFDIISFDMIRNSYMKNKDEKKDDDFLGNFYTYVTTVARITQNNDVKNVFQGLGEWMKSRARKYCVQYCKHYNYQLLKQKAA